MSTQPERETRERASSPTRRELANAIRALSMDAVQEANSGHPGMPMGMADIAQVLWGDYLRHNPANPGWVDRDRFVLSNGHGSMLLYALLHLTGYALPLEEIKRFRQLHSMTPGHPELGCAPGVETTTGPLGQGLANAVGMAIAEKVLAAQFNRPQHTVINHHTYVFLGDGCLMEGISHEACSLAGHLRLGNLIGFYDDNGVSIDGDVHGWFTEDTPKRFETYGWHVIAEVDGHDAEQVKQAVEAARAETERPSLICCQTVIGWGAPNKQGDASCHGAALGEEEVALARRTIDWLSPPFVVPEAIYEAWSATERGAHAEAAWLERFAAYQKAFPELAGQLQRRTGAELPREWRPQAAELIRSVGDEKAQPVATRKASQQALELFGPLLPELIGGSADLSGSNNTLWSGSRALGGGDDDANYIYYGVREFAMSAVMNGLALHGGFIPYGGTFLTFSDYARNALRLAAMMGVRSIFVYTHDSLGVGEDGPTHQPVEQAASLRLIPGMSLWRPCDALETAVAWRMAIERKQGPTCLLLTRQALPHQSRDSEQIANVARGGYILRDTDRTPDAIIIATGSEVSIAVEAADSLQEQGKRVRVVSMPSTDVFDAQDADYQQLVLPAEVTARVAVEAGVPGYWLKYVGLNGRVIGLDRFGESGPAAAVFEYFGFTADNVARATESLGI